MFLKVINFFVGIFGYQYIIDKRPIEVSKQHHLEDDEGWDDIHDLNPKYRLVKKYR